MMSLSEQANDIAGPIDNHCEQTGNVSAQYAHVEYLQLGDGCVLSAQHDFARLLASEPNLGFYDHRIDHAADTAEASLGYDRLETERRQHGRTKHGAVGAGIDQELGPLPRPVTRQNLAADHWARMPSSHRSHSPSIRIDAVYFFAGDVAEKAAIIIRMGRRGQG